MSAFHVGNRPQAQEVECICCHRKYVAIPGPGYDVCYQCKWKLDPVTMSIHMKLCALSQRLDRLEQLISTLKGGV